MRFAQLTYCVAARAIKRGTDNAAAAAADDAANADADDDDDDDQNHTTATSADLRRLPSVEALRPALAAFCARKPI